MAGVVEWRGPVAWPGSVAWLGRWRGWGRALRRDRGGGGELVLCLRVSTCGWREVRKGRGAVRERGTVVGAGGSPHSPGWALVLLASVPMGTGPSWSDCPEAHGAVNSWVQPGQA